MIVLGIETSCDETSAAVVKDGRVVLSNIIASQVDLHAPFGGVVPEIAARRHIECIGFIVDEAIKQSGVALAEIDAYAVANGPGLAGALLVGLNYAKGLAYAYQKPLVGVHHIEGHVCANYLNGGDLRPPFLALVVSGGHTSILAVKDYDTYEVLGATRDDAAGEAFDKTARVLGLPYPGGPQIDKLARIGNPFAANFPRAKMDGLDFSFSGLKTAVMQYMAKREKQNEHENPALGTVGETNASRLAHTNTKTLVGAGLSRPTNSEMNHANDIADIAASFQKAVVDVLVEKTITACLQEGYTNVALAGGVACNTGLRDAMEAACNEKGLRLFMPQPIFCTDNAAMIASRGYYRLQDGHRDDWNLNAFPGRMV